ncbi:hypothetical protein LTR49_021752 [Elasticomyces elasticus]|nr:hypothetical protein LTR49_021752 [Elasticomyces elasticus]
MMAEQQRPPHFLDTVRVRLSSQGYDSTAISLPSVGKATHDMSEDVQVIHLAAQALCDQGKDVILVMWSYSEQPGSEAMRSLSHLKRGDKAGAVVRLVFIMAYIVPEHFQPAAFDDYLAFVNWMQPGLDKEAGLSTISAEIAKRVVYNDMTDADGDKWAKDLRPWSIGCTFSRSTYAGWRVIPSTYVFSKEDKEGLGFMVDTEEVVDAGHAVMISRPEWTAGMLSRSAKGVRA